jgi:tripartite-type tricarboxylate transporter receptor subunit TctC
MKKETDMHCNLDRRQLLALAAAGLSPWARAAAWPEKPVRLVVPSGPTTPGDSVARALVDLLHVRLGQPIVIDNRSGAQGFIGLEAVVKAPPDGYTFGLLNIQQAIIPAMRAKMPFKVTTALQPVVQLTTEATVLVVASSLPPTTASALVDYAQAQKGKLSYGSSGNGSPSHVGMELFRRKAGFEAMHVPYRTPSAVITDIAGGLIHLALLNSAAVIQALPTGRIRPLAVSSDRRLGRLPDVPTFQDAGYGGVDLRGWVGVVAPAGTEPAIVDRMNAELNKVLEQTEAIERLRSNGSEPAGGTVKQFAGHVAKETERWSQVVTAAGIRMS